MTTREYQEHDPEFAKKVQNMEQVASLAEMKDSLEQEQNQVQRQLRAMQLGVILPDQVAVQRQQSLAVGGAAEG